MNINIIEEQASPLEITIKCRKVTDRIHRLKSHIELFDTQIQGKYQGDTCLVNIWEILYFEAVDDRTFLYTKDAVMETTHRLYELEQILSEQDFIRISKSQIMNVNHVKLLHPELNRTILATMCNGERLSVSRRYVPELKKLLSIK